MILAKSLDYALKPNRNIDDAINQIKVQKNAMTDQQMISDYDEILAKLEKASDEIIHAIVLFQKHEGSL
jgi:hypothetical protein